jgi:DNA mismatch repair protein MutH
MRAARKQADPQMAFIVPVKTHARRWRRAWEEGEVRLLDRRLWIPARGRQSMPSAVVIFGRPARVVEWVRP